MGRFNPVERKRFIDWWYAQPPCQRSLFYITDEERDEWAHGQAQDVLEPPAGNEGAASREAEWSCDTVGAVLGISGERVRQIERRAIRKILDALRGHLGRALELERPGDLPGRGTDQLTRAEWLAVMVGIMASIDGLTSEDVAALERARAKEPHRAR
jgi:hypothetical protein